jgi:dTMP kinase
MQKGKFIVIDGSDGSGKTTQTKLLIEKLKEDGREVAHYDFPQYGKTIFADMVGRYLDGEFGDVDDVSPYLGSLMYAGDRFVASERIKADLEAGKVVVANRYIQSNMGHQTAKINDPAEKKKFLDWLFKLEYETYGIPRADLVFYLRVPFQIAQKLVDKKDARVYTSKQRDIHEGNGDYLERVDRTYLELSKNFPEWKMIDCTQGDVILPPEEINKKLWDDVSKII